MPISGNELLALLVLAAFLIGPERLPEYAAQVAKLVRHVREYVSGARTRIRSELGPEFDDVDWAQFDPRRYDPRRIVRDALLEDAWDDPEPAQAPDDSRLKKAARPASRPGGGASRPGDITGPAPFDDDAT